MLGIKLGKLPQWTKDGKMIFTTLIQVCHRTTGSLVRYFTEMWVWQHFNVFVKGSA